MSIKNSLHQIYEKSKIFSGKTTRIGHGSQIKLVHIFNFHGYIYYFKIACFKKLNEP